MKSGTFWLRYRTPSGSGKYIPVGFGLRIETGAERTTIVDIFDIIQQVVVVVLLMPWRYYFLRCCVLTTSNILYFIFYFRVL